MYGRSVPVRRSRGRERVDKYWDGNGESKKTSLTYRISYPIETYTFYKLRTSNDMSPSSTPIIQIPPSNPPRPSLPESQNSEKFSWAEDVEGYHDPVKQFQPAAAKLIALASEY